MGNKTAEATVQAAIEEATASGWRVFQRGKHIVATDNTGQPFYLGGGVEAPRWDGMKQVAE